MVSTSVKLLVSLRRCRYSTCKKNTCTKIFEKIRTKSYPVSTVSIPICMGILM